MQLIFIALTVTGFLLAVEFNAVHMYLQEYIRYHTLVEYIGITMILIWNMLLLMMFYSDHGIRLWTNRRVRDDVVHDIVIQGTNIQIYKLNLNDGHGLTRRQWCNKMCATATIAKQFAYYCLVFAEVICILIFAVTIIICSAARLTHTCSIFSMVPISIMLTLPMIYWAALVIIDGKL